MEESRSCILCINYNAANISSSGANTSFLGEIQQFLDYCEDSGSTSATKTQSSNPEVSEVIAQESQLIASVSVLEAELSSLAKTRSQSKTVAPTSSAGNQGAQNPTTVYVPFASSNSPGSASGPRASVIVPAVVVPVVVLLLVAIGGFLFLRRRRRHSQPQATEDAPSSFLEKKPELPANDFRPELDAAGEIFQLDSASAKVNQGKEINPGKPAELPASHIPREENS